MKNGIASVLVVGLICGVANGQWDNPSGQSGVYVEVFNQTANGGLGEWSAVDDFPDRYAPTPEPGWSGAQLDQITLNTVDDVNLIYAIFSVSPSTTDIGNIDIIGDGRVIIGRTTFGPPSLYGRPAWAGCRNLNSLNNPSGSAIVNARISGDVLTEFFAYQIARLECDDIYGEVINNIKSSPDAPVAPRIECSSIASTGKIVSNIGKLSVVEVAGGVWGEIKTTGGADIGTCEMGSLNGGTIDSDLDIIVLKIFGNAYGAIKAGRTLVEIEVWGTWGGGGVLDTTGVTRIESIFVENEFVGDLYNQEEEADPVGPVELDRIIINGQLHNTDLGQLVPSTIWSSTDMRRLTVRGLHVSPNNDHAKLDLTAPTIGAFFFGPQFEEGILNLTKGIPKTFDVTVDVVENGKFRFGYGVSAGTQIHFGLDPAAPLTSMGVASDIAFMNWNNNFNGISAPWDGEVSVGLSPTDPSRVILNENYTALSSEIGGGVFGKAPFNFHQRESAPDPGETRDCNPYQLEQRALGLGDQLTAIDISHYGPIFIEGTGPHFRVEFMPWMDVNQIWVDRTSMFEVDTAITGTNSGSTGRVARIKTIDPASKAFKAAGTWRIRPISGKVKCAIVFGSPDVSYISSVVSGDLGAAGSWNWYQFDVRLELQPGVFALDSGNGVQANDLTQWMITPFETNADGETDTQDFIDMAEQYTGN